MASLETVPLPRVDSDDVEAALKFYAEARDRIETFLVKYERVEGERTLGVLKGFLAQKEYARCQERLLDLAKYLAVESASNPSPDWARLTSLIQWRDHFEKVRGSRSLDMDSKLWAKLQARLTAHRALMETATAELNSFIEKCTNDVANYPELQQRLIDVLAGLPSHPLWLEKKRWSGKISAFPELQTLWQKIITGAVAPDSATRLFCFNLIRLCNPIASPHGPELTQTVNAFIQQDDKLTSWVLDHLKLRLRNIMQEAARSDPHAEAELRRLATLQRIRGTVRELVNEHRDYLLNAKRCWMMSPTSLANLIHTSIFDKNQIPFDLVIFDEASQIRVFDGLLAMAFGKQVVIVGDNNQLPPTNFFASFSNAEAEAELKKIPFFVRGKARRNTEKYAATKGIATITVETLYDAKAHYAR
jgi:hypothetical protein